MRAAMMTRHTSPGRAGRLWWVGLCVLLGLGSLAPWAEAARRIRFQPKKGKARVIQEKHIAWKPLRGTQAQTWILWGWNDKGYMVTAFLISTRFLFVSRFGVQLTIRLPSGKVIHRVKEYKLDKLKARKDRLSLKINKQHSWIGGLKKGQLKIDYGKWACELRYTRVLKGYRYMGGPLKMGKKLFEGIPFGPSLKLQGRIKVNGSWVGFRGVGYADYSLQTIVPKRLARRWYAMRATDGGHTLVATHLWTHKRWRPSSLPTISIAAGKKWIFHGVPRTVRFRTSQTKVDAKAKYKVPMRVQYRCKGDDGSRYSVDIRHTVQYARLDLMSHINPLLRFVLQRLLSKPFMFRFKATVRLTLKPKGKASQVKTMTGYGEWLFVQ